jgi:site-specific DNA-methyltransferase (adenine-specific)
METQAGTQQATRKDRSGTVMVGQALFSSSGNEWETPDWLWEELDIEFNFDLDAAASEENAKLSFYYTEEDDALGQPWYNRVEGVCNIWVNPPYGRGIVEWVRKAYIESQRGATVVVLLPARTDTAWFHDWVLGRAEIRFLRGRLKFSGSENSAPFPSMVVVYRPPHKRSI